MKVPVYQELLFLMREMWARVEKTDQCWLWRGALAGKGYGVFTIDGKLKYVHRVVWELFNGVEIPDGEEIRHSCDTPSCVNPAHLITGTRSDNMQDCIGRKRFRRGNRHPHAKLTFEQAQEIRRRWTEGNGKWGLQRESAKEFNVTPKTIEYVRKGGWSCAS